MDFYDKRTAFDMRQKGSQNFNDYSVLYYSLLISITHYYIN